MPLTTPDTVTVRLDRLEREGRRRKRVALGSWLAIAALLLLGQGPARPVNPARVVEGERFVLRDNLSGADGRPRATLTLDQRGAALALANTRGAVVWSAPP
jgi:hypothetical protein